MELRVLSEVPGIDWLFKDFKRTFELGYCKELFLIENIIALNDKTTALDDLLPPERAIMVTLRKRRHNYILPPVRTERFKGTFVNRCLFSSQLVTYLLTYLLS